MGRGDNRSTRKVRKRKGQRKKKAQLKKLMAAKSAAKK